MIQSGPPPFQGPPGGPARTYSASSSNQPYPHQPYQNLQRTHTPPHNGALPQRTGSGSLPAAPGLPQRPAFGAPQVSTQQFHQMHRGQIHIPPNGSMPQQQNPSENGQPSHYPHQPQPQPPQFQPTPQPLAPPPGLPQESQNATSLDDLISSASKQAEAAATPQPSTHPQVGESNVEPPPVKEEAIEDKTAKKDKEKPKTTKLIYSDNDISPEEKMAKMPRYAYTPQTKSIMV